MLEINLLPHQKGPPPKTYSLLQGGIILVMLLLITTVGVQYNKIKNLKKLLMTVKTVPVPSKKINLPSVYYNIRYQKAYNKFEVHFQNFPLRAALEILAKYRGIPLVVSPSIQGTISFYLEKITLDEALAFVITSKHLQRWKKDKLFMVGTFNDFVDQHREALKVKALLAESAPLVTHIWQMRYAKAEDIAHIFQNNLQSLLSKRGTITFDARTNMLCIQGIEKDMAVIHTVIQQLDRPLRQVLVKLYLISLDQDYEKSLGIHWALNSAHVSAPFSLIKFHNMERLPITLSALEKAGHGELISNPTLFTADQETASIEAGEEIPYQEISQSGGTGVTFKKAVLSLKVTPQIMPGKQVRLKLQVNEDKPSSRIVLGVPAINTRQITTNIAVKAGETVVLGGIYEIHNTTEDGRIPGFYKIPLVGSLLSQQNDIKHKRELLIFVTPEIIGQ